MSKSIASKSVFDIDGRPTLLKTIPLSMQHILAMITNAITIPSIIAGVTGASVTQQILLVQFALIIAGIGTLIQCYPIGTFGARLPIVFGVGFTCLPVMISIGGEFGLASIFGAQLIAGIVTILLGFVLKRIRKYFPNMISGVVILTVGLSLSGVVVKNMAGGADTPGFGSPLNWSIAIITLVSIIIFSQFGKGYFKVASLFFGIMVGYIICICFGLVDFTPVADASWFALPKPFQLGLDFHTPAIFTMVIMAIVNSVQTMGDLSATTMGGLNRTISDKELSNGVMGNGLVTVVGALFGGMPTSSFSGNVGIVIMTKVVSRFVMFIVAMFMIVSGFVPKLASLMTTIPTCVLGGAIAAVLGMITMTGIKLIVSDELTSRNITIVGIAITLGMGVSQAPQALSYLPSFAANVLGGSPVVLATLIAFVLNILLPIKTAADESNEREKLKEEI